MARARDAVEVLRRALAGSGWEYGALWEVPREEWPSGLASAYDGYRDGMAALIGALARHDGRDPDALDVDEQARYALVALALV
ncbi:hypothetical protein LO762_15660 [Actinocorallia sp. API 0066]|uniref:hypothetical protein n=1 Tax=Actinocorallia sp. API 0066 TaxID=2896846 RepID=UPI001E5B0E2C|nr:hypothetical protein [Actinocorallia sp. API 0066]MCD0450615.1 hypothetical protein [Actinocorallia sp. API 0066]